MRYSLLASLLALAPAALAQTTPADTTRLRYTEETGAAPAAAVPVPRATRQQWKLGLNNFLLDDVLSPYGIGSYYSYYTRVGLHLAYERQVGRAFSVQAEVSPALTYASPSYADDIRGGAALRAQLQGRYYYNLERRLRRGRRPNQFAANYVALALSTGTNFGGTLRETPYYLLLNQRGFAADAALLYGLQRRLGRYGFLDAAVGVSGLLAGGDVRDIGLAGSLRVGLALPEAGRAVAPVPADEATTLLPKAYVGVQVGGYSYRLHYPADNPLLPNTTTAHGNEQWITDYNQISEANGHGSYTQYLFPLPTAYAGYYLTPRLAAQAGVQHERHETFAGATDIVVPTGQGYYDEYYVPNATASDQQWAVPVQLRYSLAPAPQQQLKVEALAGITALWSAVRLREYAIANRQATGQVVREFYRSAFSLHGSVGLAVVYGFGRRRRVQAVLEGVATRDLGSGFRNTEPVQGGASLGVRYRFGYR